jgi:hypothetical protein
MNSRILSVTVCAVGLSCTAFAADYKELAAEGYRWITVDGPYACTTEQEVQSSAPGTSSMNPESAGQPRTALGSKRR